MTEVKRVCIVCDKELRTSLPSCEEDSLSAGPLNGIYLESYGNYGSSEFDPLDDTCCETYICDECFKLKRSSFHFVTRKRNR